jgi:DNA-binding HxlR family transcriptional regulator
LAAASFTVTIDDFYTNITLLSTLTGINRRWALPVIVELHRSQGCKFVTLVNVLGVARETLRETLEALLDAGLVARNPGYGHPMRPEYVLTAPGLRLAPVAERLLEELERRNALELGLKKWSLPILVALGRESRFGELRSRLTPVTPRALTLALKALVQAGLVERRIHEAFPPATSYRLTSSGRPLSRLAARLG